MRLEGRRAQKRENLCLQFNSCLSQIFSALISLCSAAMPSLAPFLGSYIYLTWQQSQNTIEKAANMSSVFFKEINLDLSYTNTDSKR